jgi:hypothetical protein
MRTRIEPPFCRRAEFPQRADCWISGATMPFCECVPSDLVSYLPSVGRLRVALIRCQRASSRSAARLGAPTLCARPVRAGPRARRRPVARRRSERGAKYWRHVLSEIKNRGTRDVCIVVCDGLNGLPDAVSAVLPQAILQTCVIRLLSVYRPSGSVFRSAARGSASWFERRSILSLRRCP